MQPITDLVLSEVDEAAGIATLTFNRPEVFNALDVPMAAAFEQAVARIARQPGLRCVVLTGAGPAFVSGGDVGSFAARIDSADRLLDELLNHMHPAILTLRRIDAPVVAAVNGVAAGAGLSLVLAADHVVAAGSARFVMAYDRLGVPPDCGGSWFLARKVGRATAFDMMLTGRTLDADEARAAGIVNTVADDFDTEWRAAAARIAAGPTRAFGHFKRLMDSDRPLAAQMEDERAAFADCTRGEDFRAAVAAFARKQKAIFRGR